MSIPASSRSSVALAVSLSVLAVGSWCWQRGIVRAHAVEVTSDSWDRVKTEYPIFENLPEAQSLSSEKVDAVIRANPFSPKRRLAPPPSGGDSQTGGGTSSEPATPKFIYKGRVNLGNRQRAIVEETTAHKTYFLEVGQEVAGFKVLDIAENRVVLSDPQTNKEVVVSLASTGSH